MVAQLEDSHWTDRHIKYDKKRDMWVGYDEAGLEHCSSIDREWVKNGLIHYAANLD